MRKFLGCVFLTICCHYAQSSRRLLGTEYSNEPRYSAQRPQWRTKENFRNFYKPELRTSRNIEPGHNPFRNNINTKSLNRKIIFDWIFFQFHFKRLYLPCASVSPWFWDEKESRVKDHLAQLPQGKLSEKATLTLEQFVAELKKRIQDKERLKNNQSLPKKKLRLPKQKNDNEKQKINPKQEQQRNTSKEPKSSSLNKSKKEKTREKSVEKKDLKRNNKSGVTVVKKKKEPTSTVPRPKKHPKFIPKEGFQ